MVTLLKIMKVLKQHQLQLGFLPSYFYKNILLKLVEENPHASWEKGDRAQRFVIHTLTFTKAALIGQQIPIRIENQSAWLFDKPPNGACTHSIRLNWHALKAFL